MSQPDECPSESQLRALLSGALAEAEATALTAHLDVCATCRSILDRMAGASRLSDDLPEKLRLEPDCDSPELRDVLNGLRGPSPTTATAAAPRAESAVESKLPRRIGQYRIEGAIGAGGMGRVLKAYDPDLHRVVAIKMMAENLAANGTARNRFTREARAAASISHDHVVTIHGVHADDGVPYIVMQYVQGKSLQERIDESGALGLLEVLRIGTQIASGLSAAHAQGIVHRDIKPANILLENGVERVKITDFGLARVNDDLVATVSGVIAGTPQYMSPEQAKGEPVDHRSDLFSLGSVLYAMATGEPPFRGGHPLSILKRVCDDQPRAPRDINPEVPDWLAAIIGKLMAKEPTQRFASAADVAELLGAHLAHLQQPSVAPIPAPVPPPAVSPPSAGENFGARSARLVLGLLGLSVVIIILASAIWRKELDEEWPVALAALGGFGLLAYLWDGPRRHQSNPKKARDPHSLAMFGITAVLGGLCLLALDAKHVVRTIFFAGWPVLIVGGIGVLALLLAWTFLGRFQRDDGPRHRRVFLWTLIPAILIAGALFALGYVRENRHRLTWNGPAGHGILRVNVHDAGIWVRIDGVRAARQEFSGGAPTAEYVPIGNYTVTARKGNDIVFQERVELVAEGQTAFVDIPHRGEVRFIPPEFRVVIDGDEVHVEGYFSLPVGQHRWTAAHKDVRAEGEFILRSGERLTIDVSSKKSAESADVEKLRIIVNNAKGKVDVAQLRFEGGVINIGELRAAEIEYLEAAIRLAAAEMKPGVRLTLLRELVRKRTEYHSQVKALVEVGTLPVSAIQDAESKLEIAKLDLLAAEAAAPKRQ